MSDPGVSTVLHHIRKLAAGPTDRELVAAFVARRDEEAFAALVGRHGGMVLGVCRSVLGTSAGAEDVFQACFLVLARKAAGIRRQASLAAWLHGVAYRLACKQRGREARRRRVEARAARPEAAAVDDLTWRELREVLHAELDRLPEKYRAPLLLCYWAGKTQEEAALELGWTRAAVKERLARARALLRGRLNRRGLALALPFAAGLLAPEPAGAAALALLVRTTAAGVLSPATLSAHTLRLADHAVRTLPAFSLKTTVLLIVAVAALAGAALALYPGGAKDPVAEAPQGAGRPAPVPRTDNFGDPLPAGAIARLGTVRFRTAEWVGPFALSPDGRTLAASAGRAVSLWETGTGKPVARFELTDAARGLAFAPAGDRIAVGSADGTIRLLEASSGKEVRRFVGHVADPKEPFGGIDGVLFGPGGRSLVSWASDQTLRLWETATGRQVRTFGPDKVPVGSAALSADGRWLAASTWNPGAAAQPVQLWDVETGRAVRSFRTPHEPGALAFSPDGTTLAVAFAKEVQEAGKVLLFEAATGKEVRTLAGHDAAVFALAFAPDGKRLATAGYDETIRLWDLGSGGPVWKAGPLGTPVYQLAFSRDGRALVSRGAENRVRVWDPADGKEVRPLEAPEWGVAAVAWTPDGKRVALASSRKVWVYDPATGRVLQQLAGHKYAINSMAVAGRGDLLTSGGQDGFVRLWDPGTGQEIRRIKASQRWVDRLAVAPDGRVLATWSMEDEPRAVVLWDARTGRELRRLEVTSDQPQAIPTIHTLLFSPDGSTVWAGSGTHLVLQRWEAATGKVLPPVGRHDGGLSGVALSRDGRAVAAASLAGTVYLWETATGQARLVVKDAGYTTCLAFSPDGTLLALGNSGSHHHHAPDGRLVAEGYDNREQVRLLDAGTGKLVHTFAGHRGGVDDLVFSPDGRVLASASRDSTVLLWDVAAVRAALGRRPAPPADLDARWADLGADAAPAARAIAALAADPARAVPFLRERLNPVPAADAARIARLLGELAADDFAVRERAMEELRKVADRAEPALRKALAAGPGPEVRRKLEELLGSLEVSTGGERLRTWRALETLERIGNGEARGLLRKLAGGDPEAWLTREAQAALGRLEGNARGGP
jgi:RNA polymerase sigma factor (sigma-70 family)